MSFSEQIKSRERVAKHGEVFTSQKIVNAMCDLVADECRRIDSRFLEPACGNGNFLAMILARKLAECRRAYGKSPADYERSAITALTSLYGVELLQENVAECRERLFDLWNGQYGAVMKTAARQECREAARCILRKNILCGNALTLRRVDSEAHDTEEAIIFTEWTLLNKSLMQQREYKLSLLLQENAAPEDYAQLSMFADGGDFFDDWAIDPATKAFIPRAQREIVCEYWRVQEHG